MSIELKMWVPNHCPGLMPCLLASISFSRLRIRVFMKTFAFAAHGFGLVYVRVHCCILAKQRDVEDDEGADGVFVWSKDLVVPFWHSGLSFSSFPFGYTAGMFYINEVLWLSYILWRGISCLELQSEVWDQWDPCLEHARHLIIKASWNGIN